MTRARNTYPWTYLVMAYNEDLDPPPPQDISNVFVAAELSYQSSSDSAKYKRAWLMSKVIHSSILSDDECPDACSRALSIALNHKENFIHYGSDQRHFAKTKRQCNYLKWTKEKLLSHATSVGNKLKQTEDIIFLIFRCIIQCFSISWGINNICSPPSISIFCSLELNLFRYSSS